MSNPEPASPASDAKRAQTYRGSVVPFHERITCTVPEACQAIGLGRSKLYELIAGGKLRTTTIGRRRLIVVRSLLALVSPEI